MWGVFECFYDAIYAFVFDKVAFWDDGVKLDVDATEALHDSFEDSLVGFFYLLGGCWVEVFC